MSDPCYDASALESYIWTWCQVKCTLCIPTLRECSFFQIERIAALVQLDRVTDRSIWLRVLVNGV